MLTPRRHVEIALHGGHADRVPFTMYENKLPQCRAERELRNRGLCILNRRAGVFKVHSPNVRTRQKVYWEDGKQLTRTVHETPAGILTSLSEAAGFTSWSHEKLFKSPDDYKAILFMIRDERYEPDYEAFAHAERDFGDDAIFRAERKRGQTPFVRSTLRAYRQKVSDPFFFRGSSPDNS